MSAYPVEIEIPVRFRDLDGMGHVNNAVFSTFLESARVGYWQRLHPGEPLEVSPEAIPFILARTEIDFRAQIPFEPPGGAVRVRTRCPRIGTKSFELEYLIESADGEVLYAEARSVQVCFDYRANETVPVTDELRRRVAAFEGWRSV